MRAAEGRGMDALKSLTSSILAFLGREYHESRVLWRLELAAGECGRGNGIVAGGLASCRLVLTAGHASE